jgi:tripartite-type tricarboxylate transporter receptor subunit TctC
VAIAAVVLPIISRSARAQTYPSRPVKFIVPLAPGGGLDFIARVISEHLSRVLGQQVYVENKTGAGGMIGVEAAANSPPDGYSILIFTDTLASAPHLLKLNTDYVNDLVPVIELAQQPVVLAVHSSLGVNSIAELIRAAKQRTSLGYATSGVGTQQHVVGQWFAQLAGIKLDHIPYRGGGQAVSDLIAGHVSIGFFGPTPLIPYYKSGTLRFLAQTADARSPSLPEVPTFQEAGIKGLMLEQWQGALVPKGTPPTIVARLNVEISKALADPEIRERLQQAMLDPVGGTAEQFSGVMRKDSEMYARLARELKIKAE